MVRRLAQRGDGPSRTFWYPRRGYGQIVEAVAQAATDAGATIEHNVAIRRLAAHAAGVSVVLADGRSFETQRVLWTAPLAALAANVDEVPAAVHARASQLEHRAMTLVYAVVERSQYSPFDAHYLPTEGTPISRLSEPKNYRDGPDPADRTVLCAEIPCRVGDEWWTASETDLEQMLRSTASLVDLPPIDVTAIEVRRVPHVYPIYRQETPAALDDLQRWVSTLPNVVTFGRQALFVPDNLHHVMAMGWDAGELAARRQWDAGEWVAANERYSAHIVDD